MTKNTRITVRLPDSLRNELEEVCRITGLDEPTVVRACLEAFVEVVKRDGEIRLPLAIISKLQLGALAAGQRQ